MYTYHKMSHHYKPVHPFFPLTWRPLIQRSGGRCVAGSERAKFTGGAAEGQRLERWNLNGGPGGPGTDEEKPRVTLW